MRPFRIDVPDAVLVDLRERLKRSRLLTDSPNRPASGMSSSYLSDLVESW
ncbi:MAG: epoxide hydrolase N-terminal domain-containing protein, partial [Solirubrobacterales bacterium]